jgi:hypothetical protein
MRTLCIVCHQVEDANFFFEEGWASTKCVQSATRVTTVYEINGESYHKKLKDEIADGARAIVRRITARRMTN